MARLQIVTLPSLTVGSVSQPEFLIVLDEMDDKLVAELIEQTASIKESTGARGVLAFESTIEVVHESSVVIRDADAEAEDRRAVIGFLEVEVAEQIAKVTERDATIERLNAEAIETGVLVADLQTGLSDALDRLNRTL